MTIVREITPEQTLMLDMFTDHREPGTTWEHYCASVAEWKAWRKLATTRSDVFLWYGNYGFHCVLSSFKHNDWIQVMRVCEDLQCRFVGFIYGPHQTPR